MNLVLIGPQGSGKGTIAKKISNDFHWPHISVGDLFRDGARDGDEEAIYAKENFIDKGMLVPDEITVKILKNRISKNDCKNGFILDGFPRSLDQGKSLEKIAKVDFVLLIDIPYSTAIERILTRKVCSSCGEIYNTSSYKFATCKKCGSPLYQRDDDKLESIKRRLEVYDKQTAPLIDFYSDKLHKVDGTGSPEDTYEVVKTLLEKEAKVEQ